MKHGVMGAGGVGGLIGAALAREGEDVVLVLRPETLAEYPGYLKVESPLGNFEAPVRAVGSLDECIDVLWITVKATQLEAALGAAKVPAGVLIPLLNGIDHVAWLRQRFGAGAIVPGTIRVESERVSPGWIRHKSPFAAIELWSGGKARLGEIDERLRHFGFACRFVDDEKTMLWSKLAFLGPFALTTTAAGAAKGEIAADAKWRGLFEAAVRETCAVATAEGADVDAETILAGFERVHTGMRSSMQKDVEAGRAPELDAIAGPVLRGGAAHDIDVPATRELAGLIAGRVTAR